MKEKLKIGILLNEYIIPSWEYQIINELNRSAFAEIVLVIKDKLRVPAKVKRKRKLTPVLIRLLEKSDRLIFKTKNDYRIKKDISVLLKDLPVLELEAGIDDNGRSIDGHAIASIKALNPDIIIKFGSQDIRGEIPGIPRYGVWSHSLDHSRNAGAIEAGFWEVVSYRPVTFSALEILAEDPAKNTVIFDSWESTCPFSINVNRNRIFWRTTLFVPRIIEGLHRYGDGYLDRLKDKFKSVRPDMNSVMEVPSFSTMTKVILKYLMRVTMLIINKLYYTDAFSWQLLFDFNNYSDVYSTDFSNYKIIPSTREYFWADPFVIAENGYYYVFVEEFIYRKNKAHISVLKLDNKGSLISSERILERPYHMSYPFIFKVDSTYYMIPETSQNKTIELYKCTDFPYKWEFERIIMEDIHATDTTIFHYNNKWWLFTTIDQTENISGSSTELFLFSSDNLLSGDWKSHPMNPVVSDIRTARPAGKLFLHEGKIYRPSQDCSMRYGRALNFNYVTKLTEEEYKETKLTRVKPDWDKKLKGMHTFNLDRGLTIIDVYAFRKRFLFK